MANEDHHGLVAPATHDMSAFATMYGVFGEFSSSTIPSVRAEATLHELAHCAVFGLHPLRTKHYRNGLPSLAALAKVSFRIDDCFSNRYGDYAAEKRRRWCADLSEVSALAVEHIAITALGWPIDFHRALQMTLTSNMRCMTWTDALLRSFIREAEETKVAKLRAARVVRWVGEVISLGERIEARKRRKRIE